MICTLRLGRGGGTQCIPYRATGLPGYNGHAYITANIQHPGAAEDLAKYSDDIKIDLHRKVDERGWVGYLGGLPAMTR